MAQVRRNKKLTNSRLANLKKETISFLYIVISILFLLSIYSHDPNDPSFLNSGLASTVNNYIGIFGAYTSFIFFSLFGQVSLTLPLLLLYIIYKNIISLEADETNNTTVMNTGLLILIVISSCILMSFYGIQFYQIIHMIAIKVFMMEVVVVILRVLLQSIMALV